MNQLSTIEVNQAPDVLASSSCLACGEPFTPDTYCIVHRARPWISFHPDCLHDATEGEIGLAQYEASRLRIAIQKRTIRRDEAERSVNRLAQLHGRLVGELAKVTVDLGKLRGSMSEMRAPARPAGRKVARKSPRPRLRRSD